MPKSIQGKYLIVNRCYNSNQTGEYLGQFYSSLKVPRGVEYTFEYNTEIGNNLWFTETYCQDNNNNYEGGKRKTRKQKVRRGRSRKVRRN